MEFLWYIPFDSKTAMSHNDCQNFQDERLWEMFLMGSVIAFETLMKRHYQTLYNYGSRFSKDHELIKDHIQELFLLLWKNRDGIQPTQSVKYYLLKSLRRRVLRQAHTSKLVLQLEESYFNARFGIVLPVESDLVLQEKLTELSFKVRTVLEKLSTRQKEIIYLRFYMDADTAQIAEIMELSHQSVYNLLHEALKRFKNLSTADYFSISTCIALFTGLSFFENGLKNL